ncbi:MAG: disulfide bond formation protein B [Hyphomicrobiales bacterium]|nr:disulfide bond formation protein B [Hyphomicrobiales bacterium]
MTAEALTSKTMSPPALASGLVCLAALAAVTTALGFEHIGGYAPCPLCLQERWAYYFAVPTGLAAFLLARAGHMRAAGALLVLCALGFLINTGLGVYHAGAEWKWWPGPASCGAGAGVTTGAGGMLDALNQTRVIRCDEAPWRLFGLSFAGYNAVISLGLAGIAAFGVCSRVGRQER